MPLSVPEIRRLITRLTPGRAPPGPAFVLAWSSWRRLKGENQLPKVIEGVTFKDGVEVTTADAQDAA